MRLNPPGLVAPVLMLAVHLLSLSGCAGGAAGADLALTSRGDPRSLRGAAETLRVPLDEKFSIRHHEATHVAELEGTAEATATASTDGKASADAAVEGGGSAGGLFQLGHSFRNDSDIQLDLELRVAAAYEYAVAASPDVLLPDAAASLRLLARDDRGRRLRELVMTDVTTENGAPRGSDRKETRLTLTLAPRQTVHVFLAGSARCETKPERRGEASLKLTEFSMEAATRPAPAIPSSGPAGP
jgi:hypothetical protein